MPAAEPTEDLPYLTSPEPYPALPYLAGLLRELYPCAVRAARQRAAHVHRALQRGSTYARKRRCPQ